MVHIKLYQKFTQTKRIFGKLGKSWLAILFILALTLSFGARTAFSADFLTNLKGRFLLQVEKKGEAWYVSPLIGKRYYLGGQSNFLNVLGRLGLGITNEDLDKIPVGAIPPVLIDSDNDGLDDGFEASLGTDPKKADTDNDGFSDKEEVLNQFNPKSNQKLKIKTNFSANHTGEIFIQVKSKGELWYINPADKKRYYIKDNAQAWEIVKKFSLGISDNNLLKIPLGYFAIDDKASGQDCASCGKETENNPNNSQGTQNDIISAAGSAIRNGDKEKTLSYFTPDMQKAIAFTMDFLDRDGEFALGNLLSSAKLASENENEKIFTAETYFSLGGYKVTIKYHLSKQTDGKWLLSNL